MTATISVIVPVYNVEKYLDRCICSITRQTYRDLEIIVVDDGSTDSSSAICDAWQKKDDRIIVLHKENGGLSDARNAGLAIARGGFVGFVDSDDYIDQEMFEKLSDALNSDNSDIAACSVEMITEDGMGAGMLTVRKDCVLNNREAQAALLHETLLKQPVWYKLYKYDTIRGIWFEKGKYHEDVFWSYQAIGNAKRVSLISHIGYYYTQRSRSIMTSEYSIKRLDVIEATEKRYEYFRQYFPEYESEARLSILGNCIYQGQLVLKWLHGDEQKDAFYYLKSVISKYRFHSSDFKRMKLTHQVWYSMSCFSLYLTCWLRNLFRVGF